MVTDRKVYTRIHKNTTCLSNNALNSKFYSHKPHFLGALTFSTFLKIKTHFLISEDVSVHAPKS